MQTGPKAMPQIDLIYYFGSALCLLMPQAGSARAMRLIHVTSCALFAFYGFVAEVWPMVICNGIMTLLYLHRLFQETRPRRPVAPPQDAALTLRS